MTAVVDAARRGLGSHGLAVGLACLLLAGCRDDDGAVGEADDGPMALATSGGGAGDESSTGEVYVPGKRATDQCDRAPEIGAGRHYGSLRGNAAELSGACGRGGPDAFFRLAVPRRTDVWLQGYGVGFVPRVGVLPHACTSEWSSRTLLCTEGVGAWLLDVGAGSSLVVSVGVDEDDPALDRPPPTEGLDPLQFALDVALRNVLEPGEPCLPEGVGRCGTGTACLPAPPPDDAEPEAPPGPAVCTPLEGDTCQSAVPVAVATGVTTVEIDPAAPQTDAHAHACGGARRRERVLRLELPGPGPHALEVRVEQPGVGLALRAPGCLPDDERGCIDPDAPPPAVLTVEVSGSAAFLFVELPPLEGEPDEGESGQGETESSGGTGGDAPGEEAPILVEVERSEPGSVPP
jgi:hypothetical protein